MLIPPSQNPSEADARVIELSSRLIELESLNTELQEHISGNEIRLHELETMLERTYSSKSWKLTAPMRKIAALASKVRRGIFFLSPLIRNPIKIYPTILRILDAWRNGGIGTVQIILKNLPYEAPYHHLWTTQYLKSFTADVLLHLQKRIQGMENPPLVSVLLPICDTSETLLRATLDSVIAQLYQNWELCVVDDASSLPHIRVMLNAMAADDHRVRVLRLEKKAGAAAATNRALQLVSGSFVVLLDHGVVLEPQALFRVVECVQSDDPDFIYSDEATLSNEGWEVIDHTYRPSFSLERLRSCPYIKHFLVSRTALLRQIGGMDSSLVPAHEYDLVLRIAEVATKIVHIPEILYLWQTEESPPDYLQQNQLMDASRAVITHHLARCGEAGEVFNGAKFNYFDVRYTLKSRLKVAIIIPTKNHGELVRQCIGSIARTVKKVPYNIIIIDHASDDSASLDYFNELRSEHCVLRYEGVFNFSTINNWAVSQLKEEYTHYLLCNNDIEAIEDGWLERMLELGQKQDIGIVGAKLLYPDRKTIQHAGVCVGMYGVAEHYGKFMLNLQKNGEIHSGYHGTLITNHEMSAVTAACALVRRDAFEAIGGFTEELAVGFGDVDLCLKAREAGYRVVFCADAVLLHHESFTRGKSREDPHPRDAAYFVRKWRTTLDRCDPYYNPNLTLQSTQWEVKQPVAFTLDVDNRVWRNPISLSRRVVQ